MTQSEDDVIRIPKGPIIHKLIHKLYHQKNVQRICDVNYMVIPIDRVEDWMHDMGVLLGKAIKETLQDMAEGRLDD